MKKVSKIGLGINRLDLSVETPVTEKIIIEPAVGFGLSYDFREDDTLMGRDGFGWALLKLSVHVSTFDRVLLQSQQTDTQQKIDAFQVRKVYWSKNQIHIETNDAFIISWKNQYFDY